VAPGSGLPVLTGGALTERAGRQAPCSCGGVGAAGTYRRGAAPAGGRATSAPALARVLAVAGVQEVRCRFTLLDMSERHNMACAPRHPPSSAQRAAVRRSFPRTSSGAGRTGRRACQASALCRTCARYQELCAHRLPQLAVLGAVRMQPPSCPGCLPGPPGPSCSSTAISPAAEHTQSAGDARWGRRCCPTASEPHLDSSLERLRHEYEELLRENRALQGKCAAAEAQARCRPTPLAIPYLVRDSPERAGLGGGCS